MENLIQTIAVYALPVLFAITLHEAAHAYAARYFGDSTAYALGRTSLNPLKHIDLVGTIIVPIVILALSKLAGTGGFLFGWAKPVPINYGNLRRPKRDIFWVSFAGPLANIIMALLWAMFLKSQLVFGVNEDFFAQMAVAGFAINISLMALNLLPLLPLDGGRMLQALMPLNIALFMARLEPYGMMILLLLMGTHTLSFFLQPLVSGAYFFINLIFNF